jgi:hypothetical protein
MLSQCLRLKHRFLGLLSQCDGQNLKIHMQQNLYLGKFSLFWLPTLLLKITINENV